MNLDSDMVFEGLTSFPSIRFTKDFMSEDGGCKGFTVELFNGNDDECYKVGVVGVGHRYRKADGKGYITAFVEISPNQSHFTINLWDVMLKLREDMFAVRFYIGPMDIDTEEGEMDEVTFVFRPYSFGGEPWLALIAIERDGVDVSSGQLPDAV